MRVHPYVAIMYRCFAIVALVIVACDEGPRGEYCENNQVKTCQGNVHLPGCSVRVVSDCQDVGGQCVEHDDGTRCVLDRTCPETSLSFCEDGRVMSCWHGRVLPGAGQGCREDQTCNERQRDDGSDTSLASCVFWVEPCTSSDTRCVNGAEVAECVEGSWTFSSFCLPSARCDPDVGRCSPIWPPAETDAGFDAFQ